MPHTGPVLARAAHSSKFRKGRHKPYERPRATYWGPLCPHKLKSRGVSSCIPGEMEVLREWEGTTLVASLA